jgi:hypothetical protein
MLTKSDNYNAIVHFEDNTHIKLYANELKNNNLANFKGWSCSSGHVQAYLDSEGNVWSCTRRNKFLGTVDDFKLLTRENPNVCEQESCSGTTPNLMTYKHRN